MLTVMVLNMLLRGPVPRIYHTDLLPIEVSFCLLINYNSGGEPGTSETGTTQLDFVVVGGQTRTTLHFGPHQGEHGVIHYDTMRPMVCL